MSDQKWSDVPKDTNWEDIDKSQTWQNLGPEGLTVSDTE